MSTPELIEKTKEAVSDCMSTPNFYFTAASEFVASLAIVQLLLRSTDVVLGKVDKIFMKLRDFSFSLALTLRLAHLTQHVCVLRLRLQFLQCQC